MLKFLYYLWSNYNNLSIRFLVLAFYRKLKRIKYKLSSIDLEDKLFFSLLFLNSIIGIYSVLSILEPSLRLVEIFIVFPLCSLYLYIINKKIIGTSYLHYMGFFFMACILGLNLMTFILDLFYFNGELLEDTNKDELSFIGQSIVEFVHTLSKTLKTTCFCEPLPVESSKIDKTTLTSHFTQHPGYIKMYRGAVWTAVGRGIGVGLFTQTMKKNPRLTYAVTGTTIVFSFLTDIM